MPLKRLLSFFSANANHIYLDLTYSTSARSRLQLSIKAIKTEKKRHRRNSQNHKMNWIVIADASILMCAYQKNTCVMEFGNARSRMTRGYVISIVPRCVTVKAYLSSVLNQFCPPCSRLNKATPPIYSLGTSVLRKQECNWKNLLITQWWYILISATVVYFI